MSAYYNEVDAYCVQWLKNLMASGHIPDGVVDSRPIQEVTPQELNEFTQCHFFAGLGGWAYATRLAGWPEDRELWTGSCPCQPFSSAGRQQGFDDPRHLWPNFFSLIRTSRPSVVMGEQTSAAAGYAWLDRVGADLDSEDYAWRACDIPACSVNAPHIRNRLYWVADTERDRRHNRRRTSKECSKPNERDQEAERCNIQLQTEGFRAAVCGLEHTSSPERRTQAKGRCYVNDGANPGRQEAASGSELAGIADRGLEYADVSDHSEGQQQRSGEQLRIGGNPWADYSLIGPDPKGQYRRVKPGVLLLASRIPSRVAKLRAFGNAIVPQLAAEVIAAYMETA